MYKIWQWLNKRRRHVWKNNLHVWSRTLYKLQIQKYTSREYSKMTCHKKGEYILNNRKITLKTDRWWLYFAYSCFFCNRSYFGQICQWIGKLLLCWCEHWCLWRRFEVLIAIVIHVASQLKALLIHQWLSKPVLASQSVVIVSFKTLNPVCVRGAEGHPDTKVGMQKIVRM